MRCLGLLAAGAVITLFFYLSLIAPPPSQSAVYISKGPGHGSGAYLGHGFVLTVAHVALIPGKDPIKVNGKEAKVIFADAVADIALLLVEGLSLPVADLACQMPDVRIGDKVEAIGNPLNLSNIHVFGFVASDIELHEVEPVKQKHFIIDGLLAPGMSGGPVFDSSGKIAGMADATATMRTLGGALPLPLGYVIPRSAICAAIQDKYGF